MLNGLGMKKGPLIYIHNKFHDCYRDFEVGPNPIMLHCASAANSVLHTNVVTLSF